MNKQNLLKISNRYIGIIGLKAYTNGKIVGEKFPTDESSYIDLYFGRNSIKSDKLFVIRTEIYKNNYSLPFEGEKFLPDNVPYIKMNDLGLFKLINQIFYYGDYMEDGMTKNVFKMAMNNINGYIYEKKLLQAKHRLEEAQARDRAKERKQRTRRLIQEGAILEKVLPDVKSVELERLEDFLRSKI